MNKSESIQKLTVALIQLQREIKGAEKDSDNSFYHSKYADLESCWKAVRASLSNNGLALCQLVGEFDTNGSQGLETILMHESGEWISGYASIPLSKKDPHGAGSGITYLRRYGLAAILGLLQVDDDANAAVDEPDDSKRERKKLKTPRKIPSNPDEPVLPPRDKFEKGEEEYLNMDEESKLHVNATASSIRAMYMTGDEEMKLKAYQEHIIGTNSDFKLALTFVMKLDTVIRASLKQIGEKMLRDAANQMELSPSGK